MRYYAVQYGNYILMLWDNLLAPAFEGWDIQKREQSTMQYNWHTLLFWDFIRHVISWRSTTFWKPDLFPFSGKEAPNMVDSID